MRNWAPVIGLLIAAGAQGAACSSRFDSCVDSRSCATGGGDGEAGANETFGGGGSAAETEAGSSGNEAGDGGRASVSDAGAAGASDGQAGASHGQAGAGPVDECKNGTSTCSDHANCTDTQSGFTCACKSGYFGDGKTCEPKSCVGLAANCGLSSSDDCCSNAVVPGGSFTMGGSTNASISTFALDTYEVTVGRFRTFVSAHTSTPADGAGRHPLIANSGWQSAWNSSLPASLPFDCSGSPFATWNAFGTNDRLPMNCVSWYEAFAFCAWDGGRLPTDAEWEYAARGGASEFRYPWGNEPVPTSTQDATVSYANYYGLGDGSAGAVYAPTDILPVGSKPLGHGQYGQMDLAGSINEWVLDVYGSLPSECHDCANLAGGDTGQRLHRGGDFESNGLGIVAGVRLSTAPANHLVTYGFRCARNP